MVNFFIPLKSSTIYMNDFQTYIVVETLIQNNVKPIPVFFLFFGGGKKIILFFSSVRIPSSLGENIPADSKVSHLLRHLNIML